MTTFNSYLNVEGFQTGNVTVSVARMKVAEGLV